MPDLFPTVPCPAPISGLFWVCILQTADGSLYIGQTNNLPERLCKHRLGLGSKHTHDHGCARLVYCEGLVPLVQAVQRERQLKRWSRSKKEALIRGDLPALKNSVARQPVLRGEGAPAPFQPKAKRTSRYETHSESKTATPPSDCTAISLTGMGSNEVRRTPASAGECARRTDEGLFRTGLPVSPVSGARRPSRDPAIGSTGLVSPIRPVNGRAGQPCHRNW